MAQPDAAPLAPLAWLQAQLTRTRARIQALRLSVADTEDRLAETLETIARRRPHDADRLRTMARSAREYAQKERRDAAHSPECR